jgi:hypothetical protein
MGVDFFWGMCGIMCQGAVLQLLNFWAAWVVFRIEGYWCLMDYSVWLEEGERGMPSQGNS